MKIGLMIVLLLAVMAVLITAKKSTKTKSKSPESKPAHHKVSSKYSKSKKSTTKTEKAPKSTKMDEPQVDEPPRHQDRRQSQGKAGRWIYVEDVTGTPFEETYASGQTAYKKTKKSPQQYEWSAEEEETLPAVRAPCPAHYPGGASAGGCPYQAESIQFRSCPSRAPSSCPQPPMPVPSCPYTPPQPCPAATQPSPQPSVAQPQAYPTININTYSGKPVVSEDKTANVSRKAAKDTADGATVKEEVVEEEEVEEVVEAEELDENEDDELPSKSGKYASCANPELSEQMDDGYCYRTES